MFIVRQYHKVTGLLELLTNTLFPFTIHTMTGSDKQKKSGAAGGGKGRYQEHSLCSGTLVCDTSTQIIPILGGN